MTTMTKAQKDMFVKAFRMVRTGTEEAERTAAKGDIHEMATHVDAMRTLLRKMSIAIGHHLGASSLLAEIEEKKPKVRARVGRPKMMKTVPRLTLVKG